MFPDLAHEGTFQDFLSGRSFNCYGEEIPQGDRRGGLSSPSLHLRVDPLDTNESSMVSFEFPRRRSPVRGYARLGRLSSFFFLVAFLPACAFGDRKIALEYEVEGGYAQTGAGFEDPIIILDFDDARPQPEYGDVRNGLGMVTAKVLAEGQSGGLWIANALAAELQARGYEVRQGSEPPLGAVPVLITGTLTQAYVRTGIFGLDCLVRARLQVLRHGVSILSREYEAENDDLGLLGTSQAYAAALSEGLRRLVEQALPDVEEALRQ